MLDDDNDYSDDDREQADACAYLNFLDDINVGRGADGLPLLGSD